MIKKQITFLNEFKILFALILILMCIGCIGQYTSFNGEINIFMKKYIVMIISGIALMFIIYILDFRIWKNYAYVFYSIILVNLLIVEVSGLIRLGAQRWINLYIFSFQPSEVMKLALILSIAKYYSLLSPLEVTNTKKHIPPIILTIIPILLILRQPDLGTASLLFFVGSGMIFLAGFPLKILISAIIIAIGLCPLAWTFLHDYQKQRIFIFFNPDADPLGRGYHVLQSKIAIGSGGVFGKGLLQGTQSKLNFLPEKNTDFIFTTLTEETGFIGAIIIVSTFLGMILYFVWAGSTVRDLFAKYTCYGLSILMFVHVFVNIAMVTGLAPVVGIPLPFLSYGGSSMMTFMISCGLVMSALQNKRS